MNGARWVVRVLVATALTIGGLSGLLAACFVFFIAASPGSASARGLMVETIGITVLSAATLVLAVLYALGRFPRAVARLALAAALAGFPLAGGWFVPAAFWLAGGLLGSLAPRRAGTEV